MKLGKSHPGRRRTIISLSIFIVTGAVASLIRLSRPDFGLLPFLNPIDCGGASPNFFVCFAGPILCAFVTKDVIGVSYFAKVAYGCAFGMSAYEYLQYYMPSRTVDAADVAASFIGATVSLVFVTFVFLMQYGDGPEQNTCVNRSGESDEL